MIITEDWLRANMNNGIGVTAKQIKALGLSYPPKKGWLRGCIGIEITDEQAKMFEQGRKNVVKNETDTDGQLCDSVSVWRYLRSLPMDTFLKAPITEDGFNNVSKEKCAVCSLGLKNVLNQGFRAGIHYVSVCNSCLTKFAHAEPIFTVVSETISFDDMKKID